jgi:hypothetical protein
MNIRQYDITSFNQFIKILKDNSTGRTILFRGQEDEWPLYSKLYRSAEKLNKLDLIYKIEKDILDNLKKSIPKNKSMTEWDYLSLAQHYGISTRLLDWSENPFVATWFAFKNCKRRSQKRIVWALQVDDSSLVDFGKDNPFQVRFIKIFKPKLLDLRIIAQESWFSIQDILFFEKGGDGLPYLNSNYPLENHEEFEYNLARFVFPNSLRKEILKKLKALGITHATIFPNISKISKGIQFSYSKG